MLPSCAYGKVDAGPWSTNRQHRSNFTDRLISVQLRGLGLRQYVTSPLARTTFTSHLVYTYVPLNVLQVGQKLPL
jgi:hypothetical protein